MESSAPVASSSTSLGGEWTLEALVKRRKKVGAQLGRNRAEYAKLKELELEFESD
jgi:hypothetical protein